MNDINDIEQLRARVQVLEQQRAAQWKSFKSGINDRYESLKPANMIRNAFDGLADTMNPESDILREGAALVSGMIVNSVLGGSKNKPLKKWLTIVVFSVSSYLITTYREEIVDTANKVMNYLSDRLNEAKAKRASRKAREEAEEEMREEYPDIPEEDMIMP